MDLIEAIEHAIDGNAVLFVGSGFSSTARNLEDEPLKTGGVLAKFLGKKCGISGSVPLDDIADLYIEKHGATNLVNLLRQQYQVSRLGAEHPTFGQIPWKRVYTTNYDNVIELAYGANKRAIVPITLEDDIRRVREASTQCVHINGFIDRLTDETLLSSFKLGDTSYSSGAFSDSPWVGQFRHDISAANAVLFVGYSAYDLDIKRILLESPDVSRKTIFVVGIKPSELVRSKLSKFGHVVEKDTASLSKDIADKLATYTPRAYTAVTGRYVVPLQTPAASSAPRDRDVLDLFLWGKVDRSHVWGAISGSSTVPYVCNRETISKCLQMLEDGQRNIVVRSDLGNGKSVFLECLGAMAAQFGYRVYYLSDRGPDAPSEVESAAHCEEKTLLLIDSYNTKRREIEVLARHRSDQLHVVFAARTFVHDVCFEWLYPLLNMGNIPEIDLDCLAQSDRQWFCNALDTYGLWGNRASWSEDRKKTFIQRECSGRVSLLLLEILKSPTMTSRLKEVLDVISATSTAHVEVVASILALSVIEIGTNPEVVSNLLGTEIFNEATFRRSHAIQELVDFNSGKVVAKNSVVGRHLLMSVIDPNVCVTALRGMAVRANRLRGLDPLYYEILQDLMRFSNVQSVLPVDRKMNAVITYYEGLKNLESCRKNPHFWLQYSIAALVLKEFNNARIKLETAYSHAKTRTAYNTFMIDNQSARIELEELIASPTKDRTKAMSSFRKAKTILNGQISKREYRFQPFRVARSYEPFLATHRAVLRPEDVEEIARGAQFVLSRISGLPAHQAIQLPVSECRRAMEMILRENPVKGDE